MSRSVASALLIGIAVVGAAGPSVAQDPPAAIALVKRVRQMLAGRDAATQAPEALKQLEAGKAHFPPDEMWVWHNLVGEAHAAAGSTAECIAALTTAAAGDTTKLLAEMRSSALITLADARMDLGDLSGAIDALKDNAALVTDGDRFVWWGRQGYCHERLRAIDDALRCYDKAIGFKPDSWYRRYRAKFHHLFGRWEEARADLDADTGLKAEEQQSGRSHPLRVVVNGPYRAQWPMAYRKCEMRSRYGNFHIVSTVGLERSKLNELEQELTGLDPADPADLRKIEAKCKPSPELTTIATLMELMRKEYMNTINMKERDWPKGRVFKVFYFDSQTDFAAFNAAQGDPDSEGTLGYYDPNWSFLSLYNAPGGDQVYGLTQETMDTFFHEGWHQFFHVLADRPPIWLNEGLAELMGPTEVLQGGKKLMLAPLKKKSRQEGYKSRYDVIKEAVFTDSHLKFTEFFRVDTKKWHSAESNRSLLYSQSWAVCYYAMRGNNPAFRKDFLALFWGTKQGRTQSDLIDQFFPDAKLDAYERAWLAYMKKL